jgi:hypothetical protein
MRMDLRYTFIAHRYLYDHLKILHCDVSLSNVLLNRKDDELEATGLLIDYDYLIDADQTVSHPDPAAHTSDKHAPENTLTGEHVAGDTLEGSAAVGVMKAPSETPLTVCFAYLLEMSHTHEVTSRVHHPTWPSRLFFGRIQLSSTNPNTTLNQYSTLFSICAHLFGALACLCTSWIYPLRLLCAPGSTMTESMKSGYAN